MNINQTMFALADILQVPLEPSGRQKVKKDVTAGGLLYPMSMTVEVSSSLNMASALVHMRGDLWGYYVAMVKSPGPMRLVMVLFNGAGESFDSLKTDSVVKTYEKIKPLQVAAYEYNHTTSAWEWLNKKESVTPEV